MAEVRTVFGSGPRTLTVAKDISGGAQINFGSDRLVLSYDDAIGFASAVLEAVGINVQLAPSMVDAPKNGIRTGGVQFGFKR